MSSNQSITYWFYEVVEFECCVCLETDINKLHGPTISFHACCYYAKKRRLACGHLICCPCLTDWLAQCAKANRPTTCPLDQSVIDFDRIACFDGYAKPQPNLWPPLPVEINNVGNSASMTAALNNSRVNVLHNIFLQDPSKPQLKIVYAQTGSPFVMLISMDSDRETVYSILTKISARIGVAENQMQLRHKKQTLHNLEFISSLINSSSIIQLVIKT